MEEDVEKYSFILDEPEVYVKEFLCPQHGSKAPAAGEIHDVF